VPGHASANQVGEKRVAEGFSLSAQEALEIRHGLLMLLAVWEKAMQRMGLLSKPSASELREMYKRGDLT
jgi:hypothetical protein